jgi:L-aspartate oxidase
MFEVVIVGAGGAGLSSAISLGKYTSNFLVITAGNVGNSNTTRAQGGIQIPTLPEDSSEIHFRDTYQGGNCKGKRELIRVMTDNSKNVLCWLNMLGLDFDRHDNKYILKRCEGITVPRVLSIEGHIGSSIIRSLYSEAKKIGVEIMKNSILKAIHREDDFYVLLVTSKNGLINLTTKKIILCCGGKSRQYAELHGYGTTNQAVTDFQFYESLKRLGVKMIDEDSFQFHPACISLKGALYGLPIPETLRILGATIYDGNGKLVKTDGLKRDELSEKLFQAIEQGRAVMTEEFVHNSFFLDLRPALETNNILLETFSFLFRRLIRHGLDPSKVKIPVSPMVHYQNGGIEINTFCETSVAGIYAAGEITGGIHGTNRLMGNSLLDILTYGKIAGESCGKSIKSGG